MSLSLVDGGAGGTEVCEEEIRGPLPAEFTAEVVSRASASHSDASAARAREYTQFMSDWPRLAGSPHDLLCT